jgi:putative ABC transport system permease protein
MIKSFFKITLRRIINHPTYSIINILGLTIGLTCFIVIMLWVKNENSYDKFHKNADRLFQVAFTNETGDYHGYYQTGTMAGYLKQNFPEILHSTSFNGGQCKIAAENKGFYCIGSYADSSFLKMFTFPIIFGDATTSLIKPHSVVITKSLAMKLFGNENSIGKLVKINEGSDYTVTAVIKDIPANSQLKFDLLMPTCDTQGWMKTWNSKWTQTYVMLQDKSQFKDINQKISGVMNLFQPSWKNTLCLIPFTNRHLHDINGGGLITYVWIFSGMALIILLLACINFMNLSTSRTELRHKEIFIKKIAGLKRSHLSVQFLMEALLIAFISLFVSLVLAKVSLPLVNNLLNTNLVIKLNVTTILTLLLVTLLTGLIAGSYPAFYLSTIMPKQILLKTHKKSGIKNINLKNALVVFQFTMSVFFITCTLLVANQIHFLRSKDLGIKKENIIKLTTIGKLNEKAVELKQELLKNSGIENVTVSNNDLTSWNNSGPLDWDGRDKSKLIEIGYNWVDDDFLETFKLKMKDGRFFSKDFTSDQSGSFILNEKAVAYLGLKDPVGMKVKSWFGVEGTIVGIVKDFNTTSLHDELGPIALLAADRGNYMFIALNGNDLSKTLGYIEKKVKELVPDDPFEYQFLDDHINNLYKTEAITGKISKVLTVLAIIISCLGLFGLALSTLEQRTKEIGIRKVNGARISEVLLMLNKDFVKWVAIAFVIATPIAWYAMHKWLENFAYKTNLSWWIFALAGLLALGIALLTVSWQSWRAATRNPVEVLKYE